ncbi:OmpP1/FadL family transporter [Eudoraea sp.]|uniref:OmpP1/FadL family transporter n=1 Tax=Eudoraea sp. TaxID=1979955 RepID=UPI003C786EBD
MKRNIIFILVLICGTVSAQNIDDVLRYSIENTHGTTRFQGLSGAFGALGGDLSALNINPAGSAVFNNSQFTMTGTNYNRNNDATYFGRTNNTRLNSFKINQVGGVMVFKNYDKNSDWRKYSLAFNYDLVNNFSNQFFASGNGNEGIDNYFLAFAQGQPLGPLFVQDGELIEDAYLDIGSSLGFGPQQAFLGFQSGVIDPVDFDDDNNTEYISNAQYNTVNQEFLQSTRGYNSKFTMNFGTQYKDFLYMGASLNFHSIYYEKYTQLSESGFDTASEIQSINFDNLLVSRGQAFSFNLGVIAKLNKYIRLGGSYQSATWYDLTDDFSQRINSDSPVKNPDIRFIDFNIVNLFPRYKVKTPGKFNGSMALVFGPNGLLSFDYSYQDMSNAELRPTSDASFSTVNSQIGRELTAVSTFRIGGEYRIKQLSLRGGYRYEQSPYANKITISDLNGFSAGIGYNFGGSRLDFTYSRSERDANVQLADVGISTPASVNGIMNNYSFGYTINF